MEKTRFEPIFSAKILKGTENAYHLLISVIANGQPTELPHPIFSTS